MESIIKSSKSLTELEIENSLRPTSLDQYVGQSKIKQSLNVYLKACKGRGEALDHILLYGPPGLGKTTLSNIIATEMGAKIKTTSGPVIENKLDLTALLTNLSAGDILFIDEIHALSKACEEALYSAMEDFAVDIILGKGPSARTMRHKINSFTLVGATTKVGRLSAPLRNRFGITYRLEMYTTEELAQIIKRSSGILDIDVHDDALQLLAKSSRGTPRIANRLLKRVRDFAEVDGQKIISLSICQKALKILEIDELGLDYFDTRVLTAMIDKFSGGPVGLETLANSMNEDKATIEDVVEPYLMQMGLIAKTPRGRIVLDAGYAHLGKTKPQQ